MIATKRLSLALTAGVAAALLLAAVLQASSLSTLNPVMLDPGFDGDGIATLGTGSHDDFGSAVAIQLDGKIVVAGTSITSTDGAFVVLRYGTDGSLDPTFGSGGVVTTPLDGDRVSAADLALQSDGKIVVVGTSGDESDSVVALARYETSGFLDNNFGSSGVVTTVFGDSTNNVGNGIVILPGDKWIVVAGTTWASTYDFALARYDSDGVLDSSFGTGGIITTDLAGDWDFGHAIALQPTDDRVLVGGRTRRGSHSDYDFALARYDTDGTLDTTFGTGGIVTTAVSGMFDSIYALAVQTDSKIVAAGYSNGDITLARYNTSGSLDSSFGGDGIVTTTTHIGSEAYGITLQPDGKIIVVGMVGLSLESDVALARFDSDGTLDASFGGGLVTTTINTGTSAGHDVALQPDGRIVIVGYCEKNVQFDIAVLRYGAHSVYLPVTLRSF